MAEASQSTSAVQPSSSLSASTQLAPPILPSATTAEMGEKIPADSAAILAKTPSAIEAKEATASTASTTPPAPSHSPPNHLTRRLSGKAASKPAVSTHAAAGTSSPPQEKALRSQPPPAAASTSRAAASSAQSQRPSQTAALKKRKKRKGFAGLLAALGCLSADDVDVAPARPTTTTTTLTSAATTSQGKYSTKTPSPSPERQQALNTKTTSNTPSGQTPTPTAESSTTPTAPIGPSTGTGAGARVVTGVAAAGAVGAAALAVSGHANEHTISPVDETAGLTSAAVQPPGSGSELLSTPVRPAPSRRESENTPSQHAPASSSSGGYTDISDSDIRTGDENAHLADEGDYGLEDDYEDEQDRLIAQGGLGIPMDENGNPAPLLPPLDKVHHGRKCLVLDLDETLLHSSFKMLPSADYIVPVEIESQSHNVYVIKRPGVDHFLTEMGKLYEVVVFTASLSKYADPVLDMLDPNGVVRHRLFRESCYNHKGNYVKDLSQLGRDMETCIIIDNSPASYIFHPTNAVPVSTWFNDPHDTELTDLCPFLADLATVADVRGVLDGSN